MADKEALFQRESGLEFMDLLCEKSKISIDVGASKGYYIEKMLPHSREVFAYEPLPDFAERLKEKFASSPVTVKALGVSNAAGKAVLYTPEYKGPDKELETLHSWSSIYKDFSDAQAKYPDRFMNVKTQKITITTLDAERLWPVGLLKVDVEGAELEVLKGAEHMLKEQHPALLVEIEERHRKGAIAEIARYLKGFGYEGFFIQRNSLRPIAEFEPEVMQAQENLPHIRKSVAMHINNFLFIPDSKKEILERIKERLRNSI